MDRIVLPSWARYHGVFALNILIHTQSVRLARKLVSFVSNVYNQNRLFTLNITLYETEESPQSSFDTHTMDFPISYAHATPLHAVNMTSLSASTTDANKETIVVASCLGGGMLLVTGLVVTIMLLKRRARWRKLQERNVKIAAMEAWARGV